VFYGWLRYLIETDRGEVIWAVVLVVGVAVFTGSGTATAVAAGLAVAALCALRWLNRPLRRASAGAASDATVRPVVVAAGFCALVAAVLYRVGFFEYPYGVVLFSMGAYVAVSVARPRRP
jgi:hypothetical protein